MDGTMAIPESMPVSLREKILQVDQAIRARMSPKGALGLPGLLDERRLQFGITDGAFRLQCAFDRVLIFQVPEGDGERYGDTGIIMPDTGKSREQEATPRGVIVSAGLSALDVLRSNGMDVGHVVHFLRLAPYRLRHDFVAGKQLFLVVAQAGDIIGSEDLARELREGAARIESATTAQNEMKHVVIREGQYVVPENPQLPEDY